MPKSVMQYDLLISCPGDITEQELLAVKEAVNNFNETFDLSFPIFFTHS